MRIYSRTAFFAVCLGMIFRLGPSLGLLSGAEVEGTSRVDFSSRPSPEWLTQGIIYQIWLRSFTPEGTLQAAARRLIWVRDLGATIVYLPPVQLADDDPRREFWSPRQKASALDNPRNPYRIKDYQQIDPEYGTAEDLRAFVQEAHRLGLRVLVDVVYLHCGPSFALLADPEFVQRDPDGKLRLSPWNFPLLNFQSSKLREYLWANLEYYVRQFDVDGFRCDVSDGIPLDFWEEARARLEKIKSDLLFLAEGQNRPADQRLAFDIHYEFSWSELLRGVVARGQSAAELRKRWEAMVDRWPTGARFIRFSANHDLVNDQQHAEVVCGQAGSAALLVINFTIDGVPFLYNGQEIGDTTPQSIYGRWPIRWEAAPLPKSASRLALVKKLCQLRRQELPLTQGKTVWLDNDQPENVVSFARSLPGEEILVVVNLCNRPVQVSVRVPNTGGSRVQDLLRETRSAECAASTISLHLQAFDYFVGKRKQD
jgi:glycosidase